MKDKVFSFFKWKPSNPSILAMWIGGGYSILIMFISTVNAIFA